jgi:hypothetical protein
LFLRKCVREIIPPDQQILNFGFVQQLQELSEVGGKNMLAQRPPPG